jgi:hypothetical protein
VYDCTVFDARGAGRAGIMTMYEFQKLEENEQLTILYNEGVYLGKRTEASRVVLLYQIEGFYAEVYYRIYRQYISKIELSANTSILDPYLEQFDVANLVNEL